MSRVDFEELKKMNFEDGEKLLLENGYVLSDSVTDDQNSKYDYTVDTFYTLYDEDGEEIHVVSYVMCCNKNDDPANDDKSSDFIIKEYWELM